MTQPVSSNVVIIDSGGANISSVCHAFDRLGVAPTLTYEPEKIIKADHVILPGVGAAADAMQRLSAKNLVDLIPTLTQPVLGICLGMQLLFDHSEEGDADMLGIVSGNVTRFEDTLDMAVPHMGWNNLTELSDHDLLRGIDEQCYFYFVHSYFAPMTEQTISRCNYASPFTAIVARDNFMGCQFHPERSSQAGARILENFLKL